MSFRVELQIAEALGEKNRWFCSQAYGRKIEDQDTLLAYFIRNGGAADFKKRYDQAMGEDNRWYCSEFYGREIQDPQILWEYYIDHIPTCEAQENPQDESDGVLAELSTTC
jgi:hypothetical protein